ncbi:MAG: TIM barrel protein, partial [Erysipelotrichaceae bacterium]
MEHIIISGFADEISAQLDEQIATLHELGIDHLCLRSADGKNIGEYNASEFEETLLPRLQKANLKVSSIGSPIGKVFIDDEEGFAKQLLQLHELCKMANLLQTPYIRIFSFYMHQGSDFDACKEQVIAKLRVFIEVAKAYDVVLLHENEKDIYGDNAQRCLNLMSELGCA